MATVSSEQISLLLASPEDDLFAALGYYVSQSIAGAAPDEKAKLHRAGVQWFQERESALREKLCGNEKVRDLAAKTSIEDKESFFLLISDLIVATVGGPPVIYITALVIKIGVNHLCKDQWKQ